jgi:hypothetical protein
MNRMWVLCLSGCLINKLTFLHVNYYYYCYCYHYIVDRNLRVDLKCVICLLGQNPWLSVASVERPLPVETGVLNPRGVVCAAV